MVRMQTMLERARSQTLKLNLRGENGKSKGVLEIKNASLNKFNSFIDLYVKNSLNIVPIVAVDFSLANLTFNES